MCKIKQFPDVVTKTTCKVALSCGHLGYCNRVIQIYRAWGNDLTVSVIIIIRLTVSAQYIVTRPCSVCIAWVTNMVGNNFYLWGKSSLLIFNRSAFITQGGFVIVLICMIVGTNGTLLWNHYKMNRRTMVLINSCCSDYPALRKVADTTWQIHMLRQRSE